MPACTRAGCLHVVVTFVWQVLNLLVMRKHNDKTAAECVKSNLLTTFPCAQFVAARRRACNEEVIGKRHQRRYVDKRTKHVVSDGDLAQMYGYRGTAAEVHTLSGYEWVIDYEIQRVHYPMSTRRDFDQRNIETRCCAHHASLTAQGKAKLTRGYKGDKTMRPGVDYKIPDGWDKGIIQRTKEFWVAFPKGCIYRDEYVMVKRRCPVVPRFEGPALSYDGSLNDHAEHMSAYFRPWTLTREDANEDVPHVTDLRGPGRWRVSWKKWVEGGVLSDRLARYVTNFQAVHSLREQDDSSVDNHGRRDTPLTMTGEQLNTALVTEVRRGCTRDNNTPSESVLTSFERVRAMYGAMTTAGCTVKKHKHTFHAPDDVAAILKAARASQRKDIAKNATHEAASKEDGCVVQLQRRSVPEVVTNWRNEMYEQTLDNAAQREVVDMIATRVLAEVDDLHTGEASDPLCCLVCGGPGVGKSFVTTSARQLFESLGWVAGLQYQFGAFQAVVADQVQGDTLHHTFGINEFSNQDNMSMHERQSKARNLSQMRWLFIDEISQVNAELLAKCDKAARNLVQDATLYKHKNGEGRRWGGLNVVYVGDFRQLPPPALTPLADIPNEVLGWSLSTNSKAQHGLNLLWDPTNRVIELTKQVRCHDAWWHEVVQECRRGALSDNNHAFLHNNATSVVGSYLEAARGPDPSICKSTACNELCLSGTTWSSIQAHECTACKTERARRNRVIMSTDDVRYNSSQFKQEIMIVANNDLKFDACKRRAAQFARDTHQRVLWAPADDQAMHDDLIRRPTLQDEKISWLQRHDKECGGLYGLLPLVRGMRVACTTHLDRSDKALLRGRSGTLVGWKLDPRDDRPAAACKGDYQLQFPPIAVFVQFYEKKLGRKKRVPAKWTLDGLPQVSHHYPGFPKSNYSIDTRTRNYDIEYTCAGCLCDSTQSRKLVP